MECTLIVERQIAYVEEKPFDGAGRTMYTGVGAEQPIDAAARNILPIRRSRRSTAWIP